jgi:hypothetical protein
LSKGEGGAPALALPEDKERSMKNPLRLTNVSAILSVTILATSPTAFAHEPPEGTGDPPFSAHHCDGGETNCGELGPLIPFHKDAIHAALVWAGAQRTPKICFWMRPTEYRGSDLVDPDVGPVGTLRTTTFEDYVYGESFAPGGFRFSTGPHGLDQSVTTRIKADIPRDNGLCFDLNHPDAFANSGKYHVLDLTEEGFARNSGAFTNAGHSAGLNYNVFCSGNVALADGRLLFIGGHDKAGNNGIRKLNIFDPKTETWADRGMPRVKADYLADPTISVPSAHANALDEANTDPPHPSDMKYQRWYPSAVTLPDGRVLILSGTDQDSSKGRAGAGGTKIRKMVPEVYDPKTDTTIALENARKLLAMYAPSYVVQVGPRKNDWRVAVIAEVDGDFAGDPSDAARGIDIGDYDPWPYSGKTYYFDVLAALKDPHRDVPAENHWQFVAEASMAHEGTGGAQLVELDHKGRAIAQKVVLFGGGCGAQPDDHPCNSASVEMIDYSEPTPTWRLQEPLILPASQNNAVPLPNGHVVVFGGVEGRGRCPASGPVPWGNTFHYQLFDPRTGTTKPMVRTTVPRHDHSTGLLLPDATVIAMGGNRTDLADNACPDGLNAGVPVAQVYSPPYLSHGDRPAIRSVNNKISYRSSFTVRLARNSGKIGSVSMIRQDPQTHNWGWGRRYLKLSFKQDGNELVVSAPALPGLAVPGEYMLFVLSDEGVPSLAKLVNLSDEHDD